MAEKVVWIQPAENVYTHCAVGVIFAVEKYLFNKTKMKTTLLLSAFFVLPVILFAQKKTQPGKLNPERFNQFELRQSDNLVFLDTFPGLPEAYVHPEILKPDKEKSNLYRMPVVRPGDNRQFNMPVYVPDSSVHYYIKQVVPVQPIPKKK